MKTLFEIGERDTKAGTILCEWGQQYCSIADYDVNTNNVNWVTYKTYDNLDHHSIETIISDLETNKPIIVSSAFPEFLFTPAIYDSSEVLNKLYSNDRSSIALLDPINEWQLKNQYLFPANLHTAITERFSQVSFVHFFTAALKTNNGFMAEDQITIQFAPKQFSVLVKKKGQIQLAQIYTYQAPLDVVYYLLKIIEELGLSKEGTPLIISGLIEEKSDLYKELYNYFLHIHFATSSVNVSDSNTYPSHFFTSLYNLATCVS